MNHQFSSQSLRSFDFGPEVGKFCFDFKKHRPGTVSPTYVEDGNHGIPGCSQGCCGYFPPYATEIQVLTLKTTIFWGDFEDT